LLSYDKTNLGSGVWQYVIVYTNPGIGNTGLGRYVGMRDSDLYFSITQIEERSSATPYIPTEGSAESRDADGYAFDSANWSDTEGTVYLEADAGAVSEILDGMLLVTGGNLRLTDGVNSQDRPFAEGVEKIGFVYGNGTMKLKYNGAWTAGSVYDGTMLQGALDLFRNGPGVGSIRDIRIWAAADESLIDGLM